MEPASRNKVSKGLKETRWCEMGTVQVSERSMWSWAAEKSSNLLKSISQRLQRNGIWAECVSLGHETPPVVGV